MPDRFFALPAQICDTSSLCWSIGEQQFGTKATVSRRNFRLQFASCWSIGEQQFGTKASVSRRSFRLQFDAPPRRFLGRTELPAAAQDRRHEALARAYEARAMLVIVSIILLALIVAAVGRGGLTLAWRLRSLLDIAAISSLLGADSSIAALTSAIN